MAHNDVEARLQAAMLMFSLLRVFSHSGEDQHRKVFLIQNYELIRTSLSVLKNEYSERIVPVLLDIITLSVTKSFSLDESRVLAKALDAMKNYNNVEFSYLE
jgi:hypothetical protein